MWNMKTRRKITVEVADWDNRLLWKKQAVRTDYCGLWRLDAQITVESGDWKRDYCRLCRLGELINVEYED
jgi:hypothetical protein